MEDYTIARLKLIPGGEQWYIETPQYVAPPNFLSRPRQPRRRADQAAAGADKVSTVKKAVAGISLIADWLGDGLKPVEKVVADHRSSICARCPQNQPATIVQSALGVVADGLHLLLDARQHMKLESAHDSMLHTCQVCLCNLKLKVFVPMGHVKAHTSPETFAALDPGCWIREST